MSEGKGLTSPEPAEKVLAKYAPNSLPGLMQAHHPIHGLFGAAFEAVGGFTRLTEWAEENYTDFVRIFARMAPPPSADLVIKEMNIQVDSSLKSTVLDGESERKEGK